MDKISVEVAIIGAGTAGMRAYREVRKVTDSVVIIEGDQLGTTCARVGCMPSKLLIAAAHHASLSQHSSNFGVHYAPPEIDGVAVMKRVREERDRFVGFVIESTEEWPKDNIIHGWAKLISDHLISIDNKYEIEAERIIIATGSSTKYYPSFKSFWG